MTRPFITLTAEHVGKAVFKAFGGKNWGSPIGYVLPRDIGKRVYLVGDILQAENDEQRDARLAKESTS